jgi:hypothetical protein
MPQHPRCSECPRVRPSPRSARQDGMSAVACSRSNVSWAKISLTKPPPTPAPSRLRNDLNRAKLEIPIDHHRSPAGSCMGGFRTPDGIRKPSPSWSSVRLGRSSESGQKGQADAGQVGDGAAASPVLRRSTDGRSTTSFVTSTTKLLPFRIMSVFGMASPDRALIEATGRDAWLGLMAS